MQANVIHTCLETLKNGGVIGLPTETVYGLAVDATQSSACQGIFALKQRPGDKVLPVQVATLAAAETLADFSDTARNIARTFWPGPLTLVVNVKEDSGLCPEAIQGQTMGIRIPDHPQALAVLEAFKGPLAVTSANISGQPPAKTAAEVRAMFPQIPVIEGATNAAAAPSTVADVTGDTIKILRQGAITLAQLEAAT